MKIALVYLGRRGAGLPISMELTRHLAEQDEVFAVLSNTAAASPGWHNLGVKVLSIDTYQNTRQAVWSWVEGSKIRNLAEKIKAWEPDVLFFPMFYTWNPFLQANLRKFPSVIAVHDPRPHPGISDWVFQQMENRSIHLAARCLVFSQGLAPELVKRGCEARKIDQISLGMLDYREMGKTTKQKRQENSSSTLLFFGRITAYKGLDVLLRAYQRLRQRYAAQLIIAGDGDLRSYRGLLGKVEGVTVINRWISDVEIATIFQQADLVILPYTSASQSGVIPIAASFSLPIIATRTGGIPEQIEDGQSGLLVEPGSVEGLERAIEQLLNDQSFAHRLGDRLHQDFSLKYSWQQTALKVRASLAKALNRENDLLKP